MAISISPNEWRIMELLWQQPQTLMEPVRQLGKSEGWAKSTVTTMVRRMESKLWIRGRIYLLAGAGQNEYLLPLTDYDLSPPYAEYIDE